MATKRKSAARKKKPSKASNLRTAMKKKGLRLPHGYQVVVRKKKATKKKSSKKK